ncbi:maleylpyruvate isomerase family mycothiol-dependent enzyme [Pseudonocardia pini]|uniref:maleylpyruvate isomerase family mycothiol-dependent enzyme n=1 Tax=Pseudonocardia pini TaxID=2758030 RepID=UPI0028A64E65|nr:maleylpyruvate isomerase family mycothiol-dependent enzyme [Pseudonocardia pini]
MKWEIVASQRRVLAELLAGLSESEWEQPSLCHEWRVRDVAAHVALTPRSPSAFRIVVDGVRARGDFDRLNRDLAIAHAGRTDADLAAELLRDADSRRKPAVTTLDNLVMDTLVHVQDIALPLGRSVPTPPDGAVAALDRVWRMGWPFWARRRFRTTRLVATDVDWVADRGAAATEIRGPAAALLLLLTGRTAAAAPRLTGTGTAQLR